MEWEIKLDTDYRCKIQEVLQRCLVIDLNNEGHVVRDKPELISWFQLFGQLHLSADVRVQKHRKAVS